MKKIFIIGAILTSLVSSEASAQDCLRGWCNYGRFGGAYFPRFYRNPDIHYYQRPPSNYYYNRSVPGIRSTYPLSFRRWPRWGPT